MLLPGSVKAPVARSAPASGGRPGAFPWQDGGREPVLGATSVRELPMTSPIFTEEHDLIRQQLRRFVDEEVKPHGPRWETDGFVPRQVLRQMGELGFLSLRVPEAMGGSGLDARAS